MKLTEAELNDLYNYINENSEGGIEIEQFNIFIEKAYKDYSNSTNIYEDVKASIDKVLSILDNM